MSTAASFANEEKDLAIWNLKSRTEQVYLLYEWSSARELGSKLERLTKVVRAADSLPVVCIYCVYWPE